METRELLISGDIWEDEFLKCFSSDRILCNNLADWRWYCNHQWAVQSVLGQNLQLMVSLDIWLSMCLKCFNRWNTEKMVKRCICTFTQCWRQLDSGVCSLHPTTTEKSWSFFTWYSRNNQEYYLCPHVEPLCRIGNIPCVQGQLQQNGGIQRNFVKPPESAFCKGSKSLFSLGLYKSSISF